jgi:hypothetical protein
MPFHLKHGGSAKCMGDSSCVAFFTTPSVVHIESDVRMICLGLAASCVEIVLVFQLTFQQISLG